MVQKEILNIQSMRGNSLKSVFYVGLSPPFCNLILKLQTYVKKSLFERKKREGGENLFQRTAIHSNTRMGAATPFFPGKICIFFKRDKQI